MESEKSAMGRRERAGRKMKHEREVMIRVDKSMAQNANSIFLKTVFIEMFRLKSPKHGFEKHSSIDL